MATNQRPTVSPPFDPEAFARESESKLRTGTARARISDFASELDDEPPTRRTLTDPAQSGVKVKRAPAQNDPSGRGVLKSSVPLLTVSFAELRTMPLDHRAGFLISLIDGASTVEMILDMSGMPENEALSILGSFAQQGIIALK
jgi:hypothetical protein